jgi:DNA-directed RNA polymerase specialized sigma24 family protein
MEQENKYIRSLIDNARRGKIGALEELFEMCLADIFTLILRLTGNKKLAEQFTIETLVAAWKEINKKAPEYLSFENWLRNIAIKTTICGLIGSKECNEKIKKNLSRTNGQDEVFSSEPLENAIAELDDKSRAIFVLNKIDGLPLATFSGFLGVKKTDAESRLSDSVLKITSSLPNIETAEDLDTLVGFLPNKIQPDEDLLESALGEINEIRIKELEEKDDNSEELRELIEIEKNRKGSHKKKKIREEVVNKKEKKLKSRDKMIIGALLLTSLISFVLFLFTASNVWTISLVSGNPLKNKTPIIKTEEILPGDVISTNDVSTAGIDIEETGRINISSNSTFARLEHDKSGKLFNGELKVNTLEAENNLQIVIRVKSGNDEVILPEKYNLKIYKENGASVPYYSKSSLILITLLEEYLFNGKEGNTLNRIIESSTENEVIALWNLIPRVKPAQRTAVYDKLYKLVPHPSNIAKKDIISLDQESLQSWLDEIKWYL